MSRTWAWLKKWGGVLFGALTATLLVVLGAGWLWRRKVAELGRVQDELAVARAQREIAHLRGMREEIAHRVEEKDEVIEAIDRKLAENRRAIIEAHGYGQGLTDEEVEDAFARLGY